jgi:ribosomal protein S24E
MELIKKLQEKENPAFERKEIEILVKNDSTPSHNETQEFIAKKFSIKKENFKIKKISGHFGSREFEIRVNIYPSKKKLEKVEVKTKQEIEAEKKAAEEEAAKKEESSKEKETQKNKDESLKEKEKKEEKSEENK